MGPRSNDAHTLRQLRSRCCESAAISFICLAGREFPRGEFSSLLFKLAKAYMRSSSVFEKFLQRCFRNRRTHVGLTDDGSLLPVYS